MKLLLHACCADCTIKIANSFKDDEISLFYYNPNVHPRSEYQSRLAAIKKVAEENKIKLVIPDWKPSEYMKAVKNNKNRCQNCWNLRIFKTAEQAKMNGFEQFSTTLLSSKYQNKKMIEEIGKEAGEKYGVEFIKVKNIDTEMKTSGFYKQFFCGCCYSLVARYEEKYGKAN
jgi:predicted adenine nucleotide alpha hydrolase (AANH) superfamily ATPase